MHRLLSHNRKGGFTMNTYERLIDSQRTYFQAGITQSISFRLNKLKELRKTIMDSYNDIVTALYQDLHKAEFEICSSEIKPVLDELDLAIKNLKKWAKPQKVHSPITLFHSTSKVYHEPYGCVLIISAWNYPLLNTLTPLVDALAAGNTCIIKPSELAPHTAHLVAQLIKKCFSPQYCTVIQGGVLETTELLKHSFDLIHYTGSESVGKIIYEAASKHLTPTILELGGKSPCIVDETADIKIAAKRIIWGKFTNAGQTCTAPDYLLVHHSKKEELLQELISNIKFFWPNLAPDNKDYAKIINEHHFDRILSYLTNTHTLWGGQYNRQECFIEPTLIDGVNWTHPIMQEEIFGPILPIITFNTLDEVINKLITLKKPLALYYFTKESRRAQKLIQRLSFGGGCINATLMQGANANLPFGGIGNSGIGCYHGKYGFEAFSHKKSIVDKATWFDLKMVYPPYKDKNLNMMKSMLK